MQQKAVINEKAVWKQRGGNVDNGGVWRTD